MALTSHVWPGVRRWGLSVLAATVVVALLATACQAEVATTAPGDTTRATPQEVGPTATEVPPAPTTAPSPTATAQAEPDAAPPPTATAIPTATLVPRPTAVPIRDVVAMSSLRQVECPADVSAAQVSCAIARVPLNARTPDAGDMVELMVAIVDNGDPNDVGPVVFLQGGPGVGSVTNAPSVVGAAHDVVFVDQRGTGYSTPKLDCSEVDAIWQAQLTDVAEERIEDDAQVFDAYRRCRERLGADGISFDDFNTTAAAADIEILRQLLGYESWSLWGISYGTRLGLAVMRDHPDGVRAAVLDSILPFEIDFFATIPENGLRSINALDAACDAAQCVEDHGDFFRTLSDLTLRLNEEPVVITATRPGTGTTFPMRVDGEALVNMVFTQLYSTRSLRSLPRQIARPDAGGLDEMVANFVSRRDPNRLDLSAALYYTTWCREEFPFHDETADDAFLAELEPMFGNAVTEALGSDGVGRLCEIFEVLPSTADQDDRAVSSAIPTLVFAGAFDPITPPAWSKQVADALPNAIYVELADHGHGMATACPVNIRLSFLKDPEAVDTECARGITGPEFE